MGLMVEETIALWGSIAGLAGSACALAFFSYRSGYRARGSRKEAGPVVPPIVDPDTKDCCAKLAALEAKVDAAVDGTSLLRPAARADLHRATELRAKLKVISVFNAKGGVGKTTLAANLGAYFADASGGRAARKTLLIDLDYQASLSSSALAAAGASEVDPIWNDWVSRVFDPDYSDDTVLDALNPIGRGLGPLHFVPTTFEIQETEDRLRFGDALGRFENDIRMRFVEFLAAAAARDFEVVVFDCPPRQTLFTVAALMASTHFLTPTRTDQLSVAAAVSAYRWLRGRTHLWPTLTPLGVVATMTNATDMNDVEETGRLQAAQQATESWGERVPELGPNFPVRTSIANVAGVGFAYLDDRRPGGAISARELFRDLGRNIDERLGWQL